jgi:hypothetical protein
VSAVDALASIRHLDFTPGPLCVSTRRDPLTERIVGCGEDASHMSKCPQCDRLAPVCVRHVAMMKASPRASVQCSGCGLMLYASDFTLNPLGDAS